MKYYIVLIIMTILGACGSFYLKKASDAKKIKILVITPAFYLGGLLYLISAILNIYILKFLDYSVVLPLTSITYYTQKNYRDCLNRFGKYYYCSMIEIIIECKC